MEKTLVIVPHEDDELSVAGQLLVALSKSCENQNYVVFTTNGDACSFLGKIRIREAINSLGILGVKEEHVFFLGYGNEWDCETHIYNCDCDKTIKSQGGFSETYSILEHPEYCYIKSGVHHKYQRGNFKQDLMELICDIEPTFIVCVDFDSHPDHRATSLLFEECMGEILKNNNDYQPIIWKKFGYMGAWNGPKDYYSHSETINIYNDNHTDNPIFQWNDRIRINIDSTCKTRLLRENVIYNAALCHKTQNAWLNVQRLCNDDAIYWERNTNNYMLQAKIWATSGKVSCLNDFVITNSADIMKTQLVMDDTVLWHPIDDEKIAFVEFESPVSAKYLIFYENPLPDDNINNILVTINDIESFSTGELNHTGAASVYKLECKNIKKMQIKIEEWEGEFPGLLEVELLKEQKKECFTEGIEAFKSCTKKIKKGIDVIVEYWALRLKAFWTTVLFPNRYVMEKKYSVIREKEILLPFFWIINWIKRK